MGMRRRESSGSRSSAVTDSAGVGAEATAKVFTYTATLLAVGTCVVRWWLTLSFRRIASSNQRNSIEKIERVLAAVGLTASALLVIALLARLWAHTYSSFGWSESMTWNRLRLMALESKWGRGWSVQSLVALALAVAFLTMVARHRTNSRPGSHPIAQKPRVGGAGWVFATVAALAISYALPLVGHGAGTAGRLVLHGTHVLGAGIWLGSLAVLLIVHRELRDEEAFRMFGDFWLIATIGGGLLLVGGVVVAVLYVESWSNLWSTTYGRALMLKLALVGAIGLCGAANWKRYRENVRGEALPGSHRIAVAEALLALAVVVVTGILTELEHP
jgi:putative copper export protein